MGSTTAGPKPQVDIDRRTPSIAPSTSSSSLTRNAPSSQPTAEDTPSAPMDVEKLPQSVADPDADDQRSQGPDSTDASEQIVWVEFEPNDPENPFNFSRARKWIITLLAVFFTAEVAATASAYVPGIAGMERDLNVTNHELSLLGIAIYPLGFSLPPLVLAPLSEVFGRNTVYLVCHFCYTILFLGIGFADNISTVLICRFLQGAVGSTGSTMVGGTIADIWSSKDRGQPMALFATAAIFGTGIGPVFAGWIEQNPSLGWRWIQHVQAIYTAAGFVVLVVFLRETRGSILLTRRARRLRKTTPPESKIVYRSRAEQDTASVSILIKHSLTRPLIFLVSEPIVTSFSLWIAFVWGFMYMLLSSIGLVCELHGYTPGQTGLVFLSIVAAAVIGNITNPIQEFLYRRHYPTRGPEARLFLACVGAVLFPIGCFIYGWTSYAHVSIAGPIIGVTILMTSVYHIYLSCFNFLADSYLTYASSALAAQSFARNLFGFAFPLFAEKMYRNLGYQWASTLAGLLGAVLGVVPFVLFFYGERIRARSKISQALQAAQLEQEKKNAA